jgi:hypothetical protein
MSDYKENCQITRTYEWNGKKLIVTLEENKFIRLDTDTLFIHSTKELSEFIALLQKIEKDLQT